MNNGREVRPENVPAAQAVATPIEVTIYLPSGAPLAFPGEQLRRLEVGPALSHLLFDVEGELVEFHGLPFSIRSKASPILTPVRGGAV
jgi:hypothetical protein